MWKIKEFLNKKGLGFWFLVATFVLLLVGVISFGILSKVSVEIDEVPALIITSSVIALVLCVAACYKDFFKIITLVLLLFATIILFSFIAGRVSYLAYYFSGDILGTGLSPLFIISLICFLLAFISSICTVCIKTEK